MDITKNSVQVKLEEPMENSAIKRFEAYVKGGRPVMQCLIKVCCNSSDGRYEEKK